MSEASPFQPTGESTPAIPSQEQSPVFKSRVILPCEDGGFVPRNKYVVIKPPYAEA